MRTALGWSQHFFLSRISNQSSCRYANSDDNSNAEGAVGYDCLPTSPNQTYENIYEAISADPGASNNDSENIYETIEDIPRPDRSNPDPSIPGPSAPAAEPNPAYGRIGNAYGRIDIIGHGIGRIERHLSSSCGSGIDSSHYAIENLYGSLDHTGRISKVSVQWLLVNKWLPLWIANTDTGRDYRIIDFLLGHRADYDNLHEGDGNDDEGDSPPSPPDQASPPPQQ